MFRIICTFFLFCPLGIICLSAARSNIQPSSITSEQALSRRALLLHSSLANVAATFSLAAPSHAAATRPPPKYLLERGSVDVPLQECYGQPVKKSCWSTEDTQGRKLERWIAPPGLTRDSIFDDIQSSIENNYPLQGQGGVDQGGWKLADRVLSDKCAYLRYEFTSGRFRYVDDLEIRVQQDDNGVDVSTRSASRDGGFDYGVNASRINFIQSILRSKGWTVRML